MANTLMTEDREIIEIKRILDFSSKLVIKDQELADSHEYGHGKNLSYRLISSMLRSDTLDEYNLTNQDLIDLTSMGFPLNGYTITNFPLEYRELVLDYKRYQFYTEYMRIGDSNPYYRNIYESHVKKYEPIYVSFDSFRKNYNLCFYVSARLSKPFSLLYYPRGILDNYEVQLYQRCYNECRNYFMASLYNKAYAIDNPKYTNFCQLFIVFMTIKKYIAGRLENIDDIDLMDDYGIQNLFLSYGLDYFFDMPIRYQKRLLKNINQLIKNKGTDKAIIDIMSIFGFQNIEIFKFILAKKYKTKEDGTIDTSKYPDLKFYNIPSGSLDIETELVNSVEYDYDSFVEGDPYWQVTDEDKEKIYASTFNYINTKYLDINTVINIVRYGLDFTYMINLLEKLDEENKDKSLEFYIYKISKSKIRLVDLLLSLQSLILRRYKYKDLIIYTPEGIQKIYGYDFNKIKKKIAYYKDRTGNGELSYLTEEDIDKFKNEKMTNINIYSDGDINSTELVKIFETNNEIRKKLEHELMTTNSYKVYRETKALYNTSFITKFNENYYKGKKTISEFLKDRNIDLYNYLANLEQTVIDNPDNRDNIYDDTILEICSAIDNYLDSSYIDFFVQGNPYLIEYIKQFVFQLIDFIKSYTVHLRKLNLVYVMSDKTHGILRLFEEGKWIFKFKQSTLVDIKDDYITNVNIDMNPDVLEELYDKSIIKTILGYIDNKFKLNDITEIRANPLFDIADLLNITLNNKIFKIAKFDMKESLRKLYNEFFKTYTYLKLKSDDSIMNIVDNINKTSGEIYESKLVRINDMVDEIKNIFDIPDKINFTNDIVDISKLLVKDKLNVRKNKEGNIMYSIISDDFIDYVTLVSNIFMKLSEVYSVYGNFDLKTKLIMNNRYLNIVKYNNLENIKSIISEHIILIYDMKINETLKINKKINKNSKISLAEQQNVLDIIRIYRN